MDKARAFAALHVPSKPVVLYNVWDAGSALAVAAGGAPALATGSASVAGARGFADGEDLSLDEALANVAQIVGAVDLPVTLDFEGGYALAPDEVAANVSRAIAVGIVGINFEDRVVASGGLHSISEQAARIRAIRGAADAAGVALFINARTDLWLDKASSSRSHADRVVEALERTHAYAEAGASGFFIPGLTEPEHIGRICDASPLPVNAMMFAGMPSRDEQAALGIARISYGAGPWRHAMAALTEAAKAIYG